MIFFVNNIAKTANKKGAISMNELQIFENKQFGKVRTVLINNEPWFVAKDVCDCLEIVNNRQALTRLDDDEKGVISNDTPGGKQNLQAVNEYGLYSLILSSRKREAKQFKRWITHDVIPSIRKTGSYTSKFAIPQTLSEALQLAADQAKQIEIDKPKVLFAESVQVTTSTILIRELAKLISQNGVKVGEKRLFEWLRGKGYLIKKIGADYNKPTQRAMEMGLFKISEHAITHSNGVQTHTTARVTGKGQLYLINKFLMDKQKSA